MHEEIRVAYGKAVRTIRQNKKMSQEELADLCGLHRTYISDIELGKRNVSLENIDKISHALQVKKSELFVEVEQYESI
ncbi:helix-turn-helix domain-containing protein [Hominiventricola aquisgranensis]|uniref:Helix-turn-helix transcriptional regulator n=1 Tax=Hominiventricola aquisgranensis TaxID=3133164 RepID=A0ABV1I593_9FIRM|nr:XRE family transcriptional regulator [Clostridiaceae bacterium AF42-6]